jgi:hypothetical protein
MEISTLISIFYESQVAQTGNRICSRKKVRVKHEGTRYTTKPFTMLAVYDFWQSIPKIGEDIDDERRLTFHDKWGVLKEQNEKDDVFTDLGEKFLNIADANLNNRIPIVCNKHELTWAINADGLLCPAIECETLYEALLTAWQLNIHRLYPDQKSCLHYKTYGQRKGCSRTFKPNRSDQKHCNPSCRDIFNQKKAKRIVTDVAKMFTDKKSKEKEIWEKRDEDENKALFRRATGLN